MPAILNRRSLHHLEASDAEGRHANRSQLIFVSVTVVTEAEKGSFQDKVARPPFLRNAVFLYRLPNHPEAERLAHETVAQDAGTLHEWIGVRIW